MRKTGLAILVVLLLPFYMAAFISIHELGHVILLRLLGDPDAVFYLIRNDEYGQCLGCTSSNHDHFSWEANLVVSLGGITATQIIGLAAIFLLPRFHDNRLLRKMLSFVAITFAFFDIPVQTLQALVKNLDQHQYQTGVDLADFMLLLQMRYDISQAALKALLVTVVLIYLLGVTWLYRRNRMLSVESPTQATPDPFPPPSSTA